MRFSKTIAFHLGMVQTVALASSLYVIGTNPDLIRQAPKGNYSNEEIIEMVRTEQTLLTPRLAEGYARLCHGGIKYEVKSGFRDFDNDGQTDQYKICEDGTILARLSSENTRIGRKPTQFWYDVGVL